MPYIPPKNGKPGRLVGSFKEEPIPDGQQVQIRTFQKRMRGKPTEGERAFFVIADRVGRRSNQRIRYVKQREFFIRAGFTFIADAYFQKFKLAVEIDGGSHYGELAKAKDEWRDGLLRDMCGVMVLRLTNKQVLDDPSGSCRALVDALLASPRATPSYVVQLRKTVAMCNGDLWARWRPVDPGSADPLVV